MALSDPRPAAVPLWFDPAHGSPRSGIERILELAGYAARHGQPHQGDLTGLWDRAPKPDALAPDAPCVHVEDTFLSRPCPRGERHARPYGVLIDRKSPHYDPSMPSDLETLLATEPLDDTALLDRARAGIALLAEARLTKYAACPEEAAAPPPGYVLVVDQPREAASVRASGADRNRFLEMLYFAREEHPGARIVIKRHPASTDDRHPGHFQPEDATGQVSFCDEAVNPWRLLDGAMAVYTVSSQLGFEAIFAGLRPRLFGQPFYAGWGLTDDEMPLARRQRRLSRAQLFAAAMLLYPVWFDPNRDRLCGFEDAALAFGAEARAWREDHPGYTVAQIPRPRRAIVRATLGRWRAVRFVSTATDGARHADAEGRRILSWSEAPSATACSWLSPLPVGVLQDTGLCLGLGPACRNDARPFPDLVGTISARAKLRPDEARRAERLISALRSITPDRSPAIEMASAPAGGPRRILVAGGAADATDRPGDRTLLNAARRAHPGAALLYLPGLGGSAPGVTAADLADVSAESAPAGAGPGACLRHVDAVWTIDAPLGFEALVMGVSVTTLGTPFYAGWGLTTDLAPDASRPPPALPLASLVHAVLIDHARYIDPRTGRPCPVELAVERLAQGETGRGRDARALIGRLARSVSSLFASRG